MKEARDRAGIPQDRLGVLIGIDEHSASARMSRYENGVHEPPIETAMLIAKELKVPLAYLYCVEDGLAQLLLKLSVMSTSKLGEIGRYIEREYKL